MLIKKTALFRIAALLLSLLVSASLYGKDSDGLLKVFNVTGDVKAVPGKVAALMIGFNIPEGYYIYANPKGPGTGMATEVIPLFPFKTDFREVRYARGEEYRAEGDTGHVFIYRKSGKAGISFLPSGKVSPGKHTVKVKIKALMCGYGACTPYEKLIDIPVTIASAGSFTEHSAEAALKEFQSMREGVPVYESIEVKKIIESGKSLNVIKNFKFSPVCPEAGVSGLIEAILLGIMAGFILNFMPCVLPVVSLKILSFVENAHKSRRVIFIQGLLFSSGIISSFVVLASLAAFWGYKWGALFQNRLFIILMTAFVFAMALSMFNVFIINTPAFTGKLITKRRKIYPDAFIKGAAATLLATPCSGPLLGGTLAWVLLRPPVEIFTVFISIGFGMALPYLFLSARPALIRYIPKPGEWTVVFEEIMGFLLILTALYLVWISDKSFRMNLLLFLVFVAIAFWQYGRFGSIERSSKSRIISEVMLVVILLSGYFISFTFADKKSETGIEKNTFSVERILSNKEKGIISVIDFTADWCPNCKLVEKTVLENERVVRLFARDDIDLMIADITVSNPEAEALLQAMGSSSIPFLAVIPPGEGFKTPVCVRDIYSVRDVTDGIKFAERFIKKQKGK